jgi:hypothetical protein
MTITIKKVATVDAEGQRRNNNSKPVFCITTGMPYTSVLDAAKAMNVDPSCISNVINGKGKTCCGKRWCSIENLMEHLDEIAENIRSREEKAAAYDAIVYEREAKQRAFEEIENHQKNCNDIRLKIAELQKKFEEETKLRNEAQENYNTLVSRVEA